MKEIRMEDIEAYFDQVEALEAEVRSLRRVVQAARAKLAEPDKWHRYEPRELGEAFLADVVLDWRDDVLAVLAAAADAPQPERGSQR